jgi:hypothetical protein
MAAYATHVDVWALAPQIGPFQINGKPSSLQVGAHCDDLTREVDAVLTGLGYQTPIASGPSPIAFARVKALVAWGGLAFALASRALGVTNPTDQGADWARQEYTRRLKALQSSTSFDELRDATRTTAAVEKDAVDLVGASALGSGGTSTDPTITRDQVF